jgi:hypothetical protein
MAEVIKDRPDTLYRGVVLPAADILSGDILNQNLIPGSKPKLDEQGRTVVRDGNEFGVYMTDNDFLADRVYARPGDTTGDAMEGSPTFRGKYISNEQIKIPRVGVTYQIDPNGLEVKRPFITGYLKNVYNNGYEGNEYIAEVVPAEKHKVIKFRIGPDLLHEPKDFKVGENPEQVLEDLRAEISHRIGRLAIACDRIQQLPEASRKSEYTIRKILDGLKLEPTEEMAVN